MEKIRVFLVDDHTVVRQGLRRILESDEEIEIVGEAGDGRTAIDLVQKLRPHVVVMDVAMPELNGIEATRQILKRVEGAKVLVLSMHGDDVYVRQALKAGARGYLLKDSEDLDLIKAVKAIRAGGSFFRCLTLVAEREQGAPAPTHANDAYPLLLQSLPQRVELRTK